MEDFDDYSNVTDYMEDQGLLSQIQDGIEDQEENLLLNLYINDKFSSMTGSGQSEWRSESYGFKSMSMNIF